jgi:outer membrane biosynthesis protein TonB
MPALQKIDAKTGLKVAVFAYLLAIPLVGLGRLGPDSLPVFVLGCVLGAALLTLDVTLGTLVLLAVAVTMIVTVSPEDSRPVPTPAAPKPANANEPSPAKPPPQPAAAEPSKAAQPAQPANATQAAAEPSKAAQPAQPANATQAPAEPSKAAAEPSKAAQPAQPANANANQAPQPAHVYQTQSTALAQGPELLRLPDGVFVTEQGLASAQTNVVGDTRTAYNPVGIQNMYTVQGMMSGLDIYGIDG